MTNRLLRTWERLLGLSALLVLTLNLGVAAQPLACGDVLTGTIILQGDVDLDCGVAVVHLTIDGPAILDLNGFQIQCDGQGDIELVGTQARVTDGTLDLCELNLRGEGRHIVDNVVWKGNLTQDALSVYSHGNVLRGIDISADDSALRIFGDRNRVSNSDFGAQSRTTLFGNFNKIISTEISSSEFSIDGTRNSLIDSLIRADLSVAGQRKLLKGNEIVLGFGITGQRHLLIGNVLVLETDFVVGGDRNRIIANTIDSSENDSEPGIVLREGSERNRVIGNNILNPLSQLIDENPDCDRNIWRANKGGVGNQACIR